MTENWAYRSKLLPLRLWTCNRYLAVCSTRSHWNVRHASSVWKTARRAFMWICKLWCDIMEKPSWLAHANIVPGRMPDVAAVCWLTSIRFMLCSARLTKYSRRRGLFHDVNICIRRPVESFVNNSIICKPLICMRTALTVLLQWNFPWPQHLHTTVHGISH